MRPTVAHKLLTKSEGNPYDEYVVFHDEPNAGSDKADSIPLRENTLVDTNSSKWTLYVTATAPSMEDLKDLFDEAKSKNKDMVIEKVYTSTIQVGCEIRTFDGELLVPYAGCKSKDDLQKIIQKILDLPFWGRALTPPVAVQLYNQMKNEQITDMPDIPNLLNNVNNMKNDRLREIIMNMLKILSNKSNDIIQKICSSKLIENEPTTFIAEKKEETKKEDEDVGFEWENDDDDSNKKPDIVIDNVSKSFRFKNLGTGQIWKGMTIIAAHDPCEFAFNNFRSLFDELEQVGIKSAQKVIDNFQRDLKDWEILKEKNSRESQNIRG